MPVQQHTEEKGKGKPKLAVFISYNGMNESFDYNAEQKPEPVRVRALNHYGVHGPEREQNFLFGPDNQTELDPARAMGEQVEPGSQLYLRPRAAGGGAA
jgi:hypothetical protein